MTVEQFYTQINENFEVILSRFFSAERVKKYVRMFAQDESYKNLLITLENKDYETAFRMVHTLKGVSANLGFDRLYSLSSVLTELLRNKQYDADLETPLNNIKEEYERIIKEIPNIE